MRHSLFFLYSILITLLTGGCSTVTPEGKLNSVQAIIPPSALKQELRQIKNEKDEILIQEWLKTLLKNPLDIHTVVQIALLNNRQLQASYAGLDIAEADLVQATRLDNPGFSFKHTEQGSIQTIEQLFTFNIFQLITLPVRTKMEQQHFDLIKLEIAKTILNTAAETRKAYFEAIAAQQVFDYAKKVNQAAEASSQLAQRMQKKGNFNKLDQLHEQAFHADAIARLVKAQQSHNSAREKLIRLLGLWGTNTQFTLPARLPDLPAKPLEYPNAEQLGIQHRLDIEIARQHVLNVATSLNLTQATRFINVMNLGRVNMNQSNQPQQSGYQLDIQIPIFDWGDAKIAKAKASYMQAAQELADTAIRARSEIRENYMIYRTTYDLAQHYRNHIVLLRKQISHENLLRYNGMLISVFDLLSDTRDQINSVSDTILALKDFWIADTELQLSLGGNLIDPLLAKGP